MHAYATDRDGTGGDKGKGEGDGFDGGDGAWVHACIRAGWGARPADDRADEARPVGSRADKGTCRTHNMSGLWACG